MTTFHITDDGYRLERLLYEYNQLYEKLADVLADEERKLFYKFDCNMRDTMELRLKMKQ